MLPDSEENQNIIEDTDEPKKITLFFERKNKNLKQINMIPIKTIEEKKETDKTLNLSTLFGIKDIRNLLGTKESEGILIPLIRKFIYKLKKNTLFYKYKQFNEKNLCMINDVILTDSKLERKYSKEILEKGFLSKKFEKKIIDLFSSLPIINPHDNLKIGWDILHMCITIFLLFWIPIDVCFIINMPPEFSLAMIVFFMTEIILNFNTAYFHNGTKRNYFNVHQYMMH